MIRIFALLFLAVVTGCTVPNQFRNARVDSPHGVLKTENPPGFRGFFSLGRNISPFSVNGQRTAFWRTSDTFRIPAGPTSVDVIDASQPYRYEPVRFTASAGRTYIIRPTRSNGRDAVTLSKGPAGGDGEQVIATALRNLE